jgi:hypothetical protein
LARAAHGGGDAPTFCEKLRDAGGGGQHPKALSVAISGARVCDSDVIPRGLVRKHWETKWRAETTIRGYRPPIASAGHEGRAVFSK